MHVAKQRSALGWALAGGGWRLHPAKSMLRRGEASEMAVSMKGFRGSSVVTGVIYPMGGALTQLKICFFPIIPAVRQQLLAQGRCSSRMPLSSHPGSDLGVMVTRSFTHACKRDRPSCQQALPFGASGSQRKLPGGWGGLQLFAAALVFSAPKRVWGAVTFSEIADGWSHLVPAICGMAVLGAMFFIIAVLLS